MDAVGDTYAISESDFQDAGPPDSSKHSVAAIVNMMKKIKLPQLPKLPGRATAAAEASEAAEAAAGAAAAAATTAEAVVEATAAATLQEVAGIMTHMAREHLGSLVTHPGHVIVGMYYLARRHQMIRLADNIDGTHVADRQLVEQLIRYVDISDSIYPDRYPVLVQQEQVVQESDILFFYTQVHKLQPGFYIAVNHEAKTLMWVIRGTHDIHDLLTDLCGVATPINGGAAHWGMWRAAGWLLENHWDRVLGYLQQHPGYNLEIIGHSMGAGVGSLLALRLNTEDAFTQQLGDTKVTCVAIATAACLSSELASAVSPYVTTVVMRYDLVPRFSTSQVEALQRELLAIDYKGLLHEDLLEHEVYRSALEGTAAVVEKLRQLAITQAAAATAATAAATAATAARAMQASGGEAAEAAASQLAVVQAKAAAASSALQVKAAAASDALARQIEGALAAAAAGADGEGSAAAGGASAMLQNPKVREVAERVAEVLKGTAASGSSSSSTAAAAAAAAAAAETATAAAPAAAEASVAAAAAAVEVPPSSDTIEGSAAPAAAAAAARSSSSITTAAAAAAGVVMAPPINAADEPAGALESFDDSGEAAEVAAAAAAGQFVDVVLYAPGRLLYVRPVDESVEEEQQHFELVDGKGDQRFKRIVLRTSCMTDHFPAAYKAGLTDVLQQITKRQQQRQPQEQQQQQQQKEPEKQLA
uniref:Fungal lipase-type domain-containing protein n=1 Tax=Tetradesmus obliquus TaxID=3088 RepID=A0A383VYZ4_TETOB|eukprot:jgi/Sobl393_1/11965/SZX70140.1